MRKQKIHGKKCLAATLALAISLSFAGTSYAAPTQKEIDELKKEIASLSISLKVEQRKSQAQEKAKDKKSAWEFAGDARIKYASYGNDSKMLERVRISMDHDIAKDVRFHARWNVMNDNEFGLTTKNADNLFNRESYRYADFGAADNNWLSDVYVEMDNSLFGAKTATVGRFGQTFGATGFWSDADTSGGIDGIKLDFGANKRFTVGFANFGAAQDYPEYVKGGTSATRPDGSNAVPYYFSKGIEDAYFINAKIPVSNATTFHGMYLKEVSSSMANALMTSDSTSAVEGPRPGRHDLRGVGVSTKLNQTVTLLGDYMTNNAFSGKQDALYLSFRYKGADISKPGSFGMNLDYRRVDAPYTITNNKGIEYYSILCGNRLSSDLTLVADGVKGPVLGIQWAAGHDLLIEGKTSFSTKNTETGGKEDNYTSISLSTRF